MILKLEEVREHLVAESFGPEDDALIQQYLEAAKMWTMAYLNIDSFPAVGAPREKIIKQAVLLLTAQFYLQREEVTPSHLRASHLTAERLLAPIRRRQLAD